MGISDIGMQGRWRLYGRNRWERKRAEDKDWYKGGGVAGDLDCCWAWYLVRLSIISSIL